jgi:hypothetical protein
VEKIVKRTVYEFKKFARQHKFWEEYKRLSFRLGNGDSRIYDQVSFIELVRENEPVKLIQGTSVFCCWPCAKTFNGEYWSDVSKQWARICLSNGLFYDEDNALNFVGTFISSSMKIQYIKEKKELRLDFK